MSYARLLVLLTLALVLVALAYFARGPVPVGETSDVQLGSATVELEGHRPKTDVPLERENPTEIELAMDDASRLEKQAEPQDLLPPEELGTESRETKSQRFSVALLGDRNLFVRVMDEEFEMGINDVDAVNSNQSSMELFLDSFAQSYYDNYEVSCSRRVCFVDLFGPAKMAQDLTGVLREPWRQQENFLSSFAYLKMGDENFRFYFVRNDFPIESLL